MLTDEALTISLAQLPPAGAARSMENPSVNDEDDFLTVGTYSRARVTENTTLGHSPVFRGINLIGGGCGKLPCIVYRNLEGGGKDRDPAHPAYPILRRRANRLTTINLLIHRVTADAILHGNGYARILMDRRMAPTALEILDPRSVEPPGSIHGEEYVYHRPQGGPVRIFWDELLHIRGLTKDGVRGYGLLALARESLGLGLSARAYGASYFGQAMTPKMAIEYPNALTDDQRGKLKQEWEAVHRGMNNAHRAAILDRGAKLRPLALTPEETQLLELRKFDAREVANWLGLPPHKLGDDSRTSHSSLEAENQSFLDESLDPWLRTWEMEFQEKLLTKAQRSSESHTIEFLRAALVRADTAARGNFYIALGGLKAITPNEIRARENLNPVEWGDEPVTMPGATFDDDKEPSDDQGDDDDERSHPWAGAARLLAADALRRYRAREASARAKGQEPPAGLRAALLEPALLILGKA